MDWKHRYIPRLGRQTRLQRKLHLAFGFFFLCPVAGLIFFGIRYNLMADEYDELIILAPPGSAKSTYTSVAFASYFLGRWPTRHILTASYSSELAEKWGRKVRG